MAKIGRSFDELDQKVKSFNESIKTTQGELKEVDRQLKLNPGSVDTIRRKYQLLSTKLQTTTAKIVALRDKQRALKTDLDNGAISQDTYNRQLAKTQKDLEKAEAAVEDMTEALKGQNEELKNAKLDNFTKGLDKAEEGAKKVSKAVLGVTAALAALFVTSMNTGDELDDTAKKYGTTVEKLQLLGNRYAFVTGNADGYTEALTKVGAIQSGIVSGRGAKYLTYLGQLGIAQEDLNHKSNAEIYELIEQRLSLVTDATDRAIIAQGLFGDVGLDVANVAGATAEEIAKWDQTLIENGIITNEQAATAADAADKVDALKLKFQASSMELMVALIPAFETLVGILRDTVIPIITGVTNAFSGMSTGEQKSLLVLVGMLIILPKLIAFIKTIVTVYKAISAAKAAHAAVTGVQAAAMGGLTAAAGPWLGIITAISLALLLLIKIIGWFIGASNDAVDSADAMLDKMGQVETSAENMGYDAEYSTETTYDVNNHKTLDINLDVNAQGDGTKVEQENAEIIADTLEDKILTDLINQGLGSVIR